MNTEAIIRAWKDPAFRARLTPEERSEVPENPSGTPVTELNDSELGDVNGGISDRVKPYTAIIICFTRDLWCNLSHRICQE